METTMKEQIVRFGEIWAQAEEAGDVTRLDELSAPDFTLVGPYGFVLNKSQWLDRYRNNKLDTERLKWTDVAVRTYENTAVVIGKITQDASYLGHSASGEFRATQILIRTHDTWQLVGMHLSPIMSAQPAEADGSADDGEPK